jgi:hypothetical protein
LEGPFSDQTNPFGEYLAADRRRKGLGTFLTTKTANGTNRIGVGNKSKDAIQGSRPGRAEQDALSAGSGADHDLRRHSRFAGGRQSLNQADIGRSEGLGDGFALGLVEYWVIDRGMAQRFQILGLAR